jgi:hypothetical protein
MIGLRKTVALAALSALLLVAPSLLANVVLDWNDVMLASIRLENTGPTLSTRSLAILHLAVYDAVNAITRTHQPYRVEITAPAGASAEAAAVTAAYEVMRTLYPGSSARADATFDAWVLAAPNDTSTMDGIQLGETVAHLILNARAADGSTTEVPYIPSDAPGEWRRTPPFFRPPLTPHWRYVKPFSIPAVAPFLPPPPPALDSQEYAKALNEVKELGAKDSQVRTPEQSEIAVFWSDFSYTAMPPGHWHEIAQGIARQRGTSLGDTARLMAMLSLAQADAAIVCWEAKFRYNLWRPITAIQRADEDGNPATEAAPTWNHYLAAPPFPAYTSGHSTFSKASAEVLAAFFGTDRVPFTAASDAMPGAHRTFESFSECADEIGRSRIYGGIHFEFDNQRGKACGKQVARYVIANELLPIELLPLARVEAVTATGVSVRVHAQANATFVLGTSTDLEHWSIAATGRGEPGGVLISLPQDPAVPRFYRVSP